MALYGDNTYGKVQNVGKKLINNSGIIKNNQASGSAPVKTNTTGLKQRTPVAYDPKSGGYGIRSAFQNSGLDASKLGWDGEYVSYNGVKIKPSAVDNGSTYASKNDINDFIQRAYKSDGRNLVQANQYANEYGLGGLEWNPNTKQVMVGGKPIEYAFSDEGNNAWVDEDVLKAAFDDYAKDVGVRAPGDIYDEYAERLSAYDKMREGVLNDKWNYDLENDLAYLAYKKMYERQAMKAYNDMLGNLSARNGGGMSSAAQLAAGAQYNEQMQMLADRIPKFQEMAYERWLEDRNARLDDIASKEAAAYNLYATGTDANQTAYDREETRRTAALNRMYEPLNRKNAEIETENNIFNQAIQNGMQRGEFTTDEAILLGLRRKADGTWPKPWEAEINYNVDTWNMVEKPKLAYQYGEEALAAEKQHFYNKELKQGNADLNGDGVVTAEEQAQYNLTH